MMFSSESPYSFIDWPAPKHIKAVFTTRHGGSSSGLYDSFNLATHVGDEGSKVNDNRSKLMGDLGLASVCWLNQVHKTDIVELSEFIPEGAPPVADASFTGKSGMACAVMVADCMPVVVTDRQGSKVGVAHAGWRSLCGGIIPKLISRMKLSVSDTLVWLGPHIRADSFEVGPEVRMAFQKSPCFSKLNLNKAFIAGRGDRYMADLAGLASMQLLDMGVASIFQSEDCTYVNHREYFSYRRDGKTGRMAALIWIDQQMF